MEESSTPHSHIWYTRRGGEVKGPFPVGMVRRFVLLGRLSEDDEVSADQQQWFPVRELTELIPPELRNLDTEEDRERLMAARLREDERLRERRADSLDLATDRRRREDRRRPEAGTMVSRRAARERLLREYKSRESNLAPALFLFGLVSLLVVGGVLLYLALPADTAPVVQCGSAPAPGVNWSNCRLEGAAMAGADLSRARIDNADLRGADLHRTLLKGSNLAYTNLSTADLRYANLDGARLVGAGLRHADLSFARLEEADLSYADLRGAIVAGAVFKDARLDKAIWTDGRVCAVGSLGRCLPRADRP